MLRKVEIIKECKKMIDSTYDMFKDMYESGIGTGLSRTLQDIFKNDIICVALYFAASDRTVSDLETAFLNALFDVDLSGERYLEICIEKDIYSKEFEDLELVSLYSAKAFDKATKQTKLFDVILNVFKRISAELLKIDGLHEQEIEDFEIYFSKLENKYSL